MKKKFIATFILIFIIATFAISGKNAFAKTTEIKKGDIKKISIMYYYKKDGTSWKLSNKKAKIIKKTKTYCKIKALKTGKVKLKCKTGRLKYSWNFNIEEKFSSKKVKIKSKKTNNGIILYVTNKNKTAAKVSTTIYFKKDGEIVGQEAEENECVEPNNICTMFIEKPCEFDTFDVSVSSDESEFETYASKKIKISNIKRKDNKISFKAKNNSKYYLTDISISAVFYDSNKNIIGYSCIDMADCEKKKSFCYIDFDFPRDNDGNIINPSSYKIYVNNAYYDYYDYI